MSSPLHLQQLDQDLLQQCMHCGLCLPTCPTYMETGMERHSPRGRIALMRAVKSGELPLNEDFGDEMYQCLGCLACVTACPAGVEYAPMIEAARADVEASGAMNHPERSFWRWLALNQIFSHPWQLHLVARLIRFSQVTRLDLLFRKTGLLPLLHPMLAALEPQTPRISPKFSDQLIASVESPSTPRCKVGMLTGCIQDIAFADINRDTVDVLLAADCEVMTPRGQGCCGSLHAHNGDLESARRLARRLMDLFPLEQVDAIISNAGGCGSHLRHFSGLFSEDSEWRQKAELWDSKIRDVHEWLVEIGFKPPRRIQSERTTYHDSCHLCHGQKVSAQPRVLLRSLLDGNLVNLPEASLCCGSAGIYSITHPEEAKRLSRRKVAKILSTKAECVAVANPGCHLQIQRGLHAAGSSVKVRHPVSLLADACRQSLIKH
mgnify:CR=1 FL=1